MKKSLIILCTSGIFYILFIILELAFGVETFSFLTPFESINDNLPFGYMLPSFFFPVLIYACVVSFIYLIYCIIKKTEPVHYLLYIIPFASIISGIIFSVFILFAVGMYSIIFKGEFM